VVNPVDVQRVFDDLIHDGSRGGAMATQLCSSRLQYLMLRIAASLSPGNEDHTAAFSTYMRCRRHIEDHHVRLMQLQEIAQECGVSEAYLCRLFQRYDRQTPYQFLTRLKMNRAAKLLEDPGRLVKQIASDLSYRDAFHFSRAFKNVFGVSPRGFRETFDDSRLSLPL
jgi:AraC-like DNA-binding protein